MAQFSDLKLRFFSVHRQTGDRPSDPGTDLLEETPFPEFKNVIFSVIIRFLSV